jgi:uncharacterized protein (DUF1330 family)
MTSQVMVLVASVGHDRTTGGDPPRPRRTPMAAYALAHLYNPNPHPEVIEYLERIQDTLDPFEGRFLVHGPKITVAEGEWPGTLVVIEFPDAERAAAWYTSPAYQDILPLRTRNIDGVAILAEGVGPDYDPATKAAEMRAWAEALAAGAKADQPA